jgi:peptidoglycan/LPS O-acetylase OafA/YrhL
MLEERFPNRLSWVVHLPEPRAGLLTAFSLRSNLRALFVRPEHARNHFPAVDGVRALSILWVIAFHTTGVLGVDLPREDLAVRLLHRGFLGVDAFFVISGLLVGTLVLREKRERGTVDVGRFYVRRALRILPAYYLSLLLYCLTIREGCANVWANLLFVNNFLPEQQMCMPWSWSLAIEEQFYLFLPLFVALLYRVPETRRLPFLGAMLGFAFVVRACVLYRYDLHVQSPSRAQLWTDAFVFRPYVRYGGLLCGVVVAYLLPHSQLVTRLRSSAWRYPLLILSALTLTDMAVRQQPIFVHGWPPSINFLYYATSTYAFCMAVAYVLLLCLIDARETRWLCAALSARWLYPIGQLSYAGYLLHLLVRDALCATLLREQASSVSELMLLIFVVTLLSLLAAAIMYLLVERPFMRLRDALPRPARPEPDPRLG